MVDCRERLKEKCSATRQDGQRSAVCMPGVLQFLHHVRTRQASTNIHADESRLLFMTYNGWIMLAVAVGAFVGYIGFSADMPATKSVACH